MVSVEEESVVVDEELAQLLLPSTFSLEECRAKSRASRTKRELQCILLGEKLVKEAQAARAKALTDSETACQRLGPHHSTKQAAEPIPAASPPQRSWTAEEKAKLEQGKQAACQLRAGAAMRKSLRDSWARSSVASEARSSASWAFRKSISKPVDHNCHFNLDFASLRQLTERYDMATVDSARSLASSVGVGNRASGERLHRVQPVIGGSQQGDGFTESGN